MIIAPFTKKEAFELAENHQSLAGKKYIDEKGIEHTIFYVLPAPCHQHTRMYFALICFNLIDNVPGYSLSKVHNIINEYERDDFDVVLICGNSLRYGETGQFVPLSLIATADGLAYGFPIKLLS